MAQYSSQTVANLRAILKSRGIPCTGLTRKQQIIDKLVEADNQLAATSADDDKVEEAKEAKEAPPDQPEAPVQDIQIQAETSNELNTNIPKAEPVTEIPLTKTKDDEQHGVEESSGTGKEQPVISDHNDAQIQEPPKPTESIARDPPNEANTDAAPAIPDTTLTQEISQPDTVNGGPPAEAEEAVKPVPSKDVEDDAKKRKRRSVTPSVSADEIANKRLKNSPSRDIVHLESDDIKADNEGSANASNDQSALKEDGIQQTATKLPSPDEVSKHRNEDHEKPTLVDGMDQQNDAETVETSHLEKGDATANKTMQNETVNRDIESSETRESKTEEETKHEFPEATSATETKLTPKPNGIALTEQDESLKEDEDIAPALHTATSALYIRNFMRPLQPGSLEEHLQQLAAEGDSSTPDNLIQSFFIDSIRTHCFVCFSTVAAAKRVRAALHDQVWPKESSRRPLWVDFIPRDKVTDWIKVEQNNTVGRSGVSIRWEITYEESSDGMTATLREIGSGRTDKNSSFNQRDISGADKRTISGNQEAQDSRSKEQSQKLTTKPSEPSAVKPKGTPESFLALDSLFKSTTAKPKLYFLPVSSSLADERLNKLRKMTSSDKSRRYTKSDELNRYTFAKDTLVNDGPDRPPRRAPRPGRRRGFVGRGGHPPRWGGRGRYI